MTLISCTSLIATNNKYQQLVEDSNDSVVADNIIKNAYFLDFLVLFLRALRVLTAPNFPFLAVYPCFFSLL